MITYYHFTHTTLRNRAPIPPIGEWLEHKGDVIPCVSGLHASECPFDALHYAPGFLCHQVELDGEIIPHGNPPDKVVAQRRKIIKTIDTSNLCFHFACDCALDVIDLWNAPEIVKQFLITRDRSLASAASAASATAAYAAVYATSAAATSTAYAASATYAATYAATTPNEKDKYKNKFNQLIYDNFAKA